MLRHAVALVYVDDLHEPALSPEDRHHLGSVRRLRDGETVIACDGAGSYVACRARGGRSGFALEPDGAVSSTPAALPVLTVGFSLAKGDRTEWAVAKLAELGVDRIVPLVCERTVVRPEDGTGRRRADRLRRIAREAAMQARRLHVPTVDDVTTFAVATATSPAAALAEPGGGRLDLGHPVVLVGPEGGWSRSERSLGLAEVTLGPSVLRVETAALAAATLLGGLRAGLVRSPG